MASPEAVPAVQIIEALRLQADACRRLGSPFTARLLTILGADFEAGGVTGSLLEGWSLPPVASALALRLAGALHHRVLVGAAPALSAVYPGGSEADATDDATLGTRALAVLDEQHEAVREFLQYAVQTNEILRSAVLLPGFLEITRRTGLPLRLLEIGASGGLNLLWDRHRYHLGEASWGAADAPVVLATQWRGALPALDVVPEVVERSGTDIGPLALRDPEVRLRGLAYVWPDQTDRLRNFEAGARLLEQLPVRVDRSGAADWLVQRLAQPAAGVATVVFHSVMWQYMAPAEQAQVSATLRTALAAATGEAPVAWLRDEPTADFRRFALSLELAPGRGEEQLAWCHPHGRWVEWLGGH